MAFTNGTLFGRLEGQATGNVNNTAFNASNATNPNQQPQNDLFQILAIGGKCLLRVNSAGTVTTNVAPGVATAAAEVAQVQLTAGQMPRAGRVTFCSADLRGSLSRELQQPAIGSLPSFLGHQ